VTGKVTVECFREHRTEKDDAQSAVERVRLRLTRASEAAVDRSWPRADPPLRTDGDITAGGLVGGRRFCWEDEGRECEERQGSWTRVSKCQQLGT
jgi:hypothetical protein